MRSVGGPPSLRSLNSAGRVERRAHRRVVRTLVGHGEAAPDERLWATRPPQCASALPHAVPLPVDPTGRLAREARKQADAGAGLLGHPCRSGGGVGLHVASAGRPALGDVGARRRALHPASLSNRFVPLPATRAGPGRSERRPRTAGRKDARRVVRRVLLCLRARVARRRTAPVGELARGLNL